MARGKNLSFGGKNTIGKGLILLGKPLYLVVFSFALLLAFTATFIKQISIQLFNTNRHLTGKDFLIAHLLRQSHKGDKPKKKIRSKPKKKKGRVSRKKLLHVVLGLVLLIMISTGVAGYLVAKEVFYELPSVDGIQERLPAASTKIYDKNGVLLYTFYRDENRTLIPLSEVPIYMRLATLAAEDVNFYNHPGVSLKGIVRALIRYARSGDVTGGSTLTQQLVKNIYLTKEKTVLRKLRELVLAMEIEQQLTKDQILEMYLNEIPYGGTAYGIEQASLGYFGKPAGGLNLSEAAFLAGLPKSPTRFSPFISQPKEGILRQQQILQLMLNHNLINDAEYKQAIGTPLTFVQNKNELQAPHFVDYVRTSLASILNDLDIESAGLTVKTTLDLSVQEMVQEKVKNEVNSLSRLHVTNGAAVVANPQTGEIYAMVGSKDYYDYSIDGFVNVVTRQRQPGSSIKLINYAYALSHGYTAASMLDDTPVTFTVKGTKPYTPQNYDGRYRGKLTLRSAFAESRNIPAVRVLSSYGVDNMIKLGQEMGIESWSDPHRYGLSLTLGGGETTLLELAQAYQVVANKGEKVPLHGISEIIDSRGKVIYSVNCKMETYHFFRENTCEKKQVLDARVAYILTDILKDNNARTPAFGSRSALIVNKHPEVAVKTGTSNNLKDNLTVGFNPDVLVATWVGNNDATPMSRVASGVTGASPMWNKIISELLKDKPSVAWNVPQGLQQHASGCGGKSEWYLQENVQTRNCTPDIARGQKPDQAVN